MFEVGFSHFFSPFPALPHNYGCQSEGKPNRENEAAAVDDHQPRLTNQEPGKQSKRSNQPAGLLAILVRPGAAGLAYFNAVDTHPHASLSAPPHSPNNRTSSPQD